MSYRAQAPFFVIISSFSRHLDGKIKNSTEFSELLEEEESRGGVEKLKSTLLW